MTRCGIARLILSGLLLMLIIDRRQPLHHQLYYSRGINGHSNLHGRHASPCSHLHIPANPFRRDSPSLQEINSLGLYPAMSEAQVEAEFAVHANSKGGKDEPIHNFRLATED